MKQRPLICILLAYLAGLGLSYLWGSLPDSFFYLVFVIFVGTVFLINKQRQLSWFTVSGLLVVVFFLLVGGAKPMFLPFLPAI